MQLFEQKNVLPEFFWFLGMQKFFYLSFFYFE